MQYRILGKTGLKVSAVGFGGIPIQRIDARGTRALMGRLVEKGVNYIDTARGYTVSESYLGEALSGGLREKFILATKSMSRGYADMARDIGISLSNLRTDYIDLYQLHNIKSDADFELAFSAEGAVAAIQDAIRAGKVGHLGATAHSVDSFERLLSYPEIETIMFPYNIVESQGEALMERAAAQNVGVIAMKPLAGGNITDGTLAMRYILQNKTCTLAIPGMATLEEIEQNTAAAEQDGPAALDLLDRLLHSLTVPWALSASPLYRHLATKEAAGEAQSVLLEPLLDQVEADPDCAFLREMPEYGTMVEKYRRAADEA